MSQQDQPITIISGTNRPNSNSAKIAHFYQELLKQQNASSQILDLNDLPYSFTNSALYHNSGKDDDFNKLVEKVAVTDKFVFIVPEYNGSYPGVLKAFIDGLPYPSPLCNKKAALVGISSNTLGGTAALSHLNDVFSYLGMHTLALRVKLASIRDNFQDGKITNPLYNQLLINQASQLISF